MMSNSAFVVALFVASTAAFNQGIDRAVITNVYPRYGSLAGGTLLTITGNGFQRGNISGSTDVFVGPLRCDINQYHTDDTTIVCKTRQDFRRAASSSNPMYYVKVARHSMTNVQYASCQTDCRYGYRHDRTPWVTKSSATVTSGGELMFGGYLRGLKALDYTIKIDNKLCSIREPYVYSDTDGNTITTTTERRNRRQLVPIGGGGGIDNPETFDATVGATSEEERVVMTQYNQYVTEYCSLPDDLQAGLYNYTVNVRPLSSSWGHGDAQFYQRLVLADFEGSQHVLTVAPEIIEVSTNVSGTNGGHTMVIKGTGFNPSNCENNIIHTQGSPCAVSWCNNTQIECTVGPSSKANTSGPYPGTLGLTRKIWNYRCNDLSDSTFNALPDAYIVDTSIGGATNTHTGDWFCQELTGFFVPQITSNYSFWVKGDDKAQVELDQGDGLGMRVLAYTPVRTTSYLSRPTEQKSDVFPLIAGRKYPIRARHSETTGPESMSIAVVAVDDVKDFEDTFQYHRIGEKQRISFSNSPRNQMQKIVFRNTAAGFVGIVKESDQNPYFIRVLPEGESTSFDKKTFDAKLRSMLNVHSGCSNVYVSSQLDTVAQIMTIDLTYYCLPAVIDGEVVPFNTIRVDASRLESSSGDFIATSEVINVQAPTLPVQGTYTLSMGDITTDPIPYDRYSTWTNGQRMVAALRLTFGNVHGVTYSRSGNPQSTSYYDLSFQTPHGEDYPMIEVDFTGLLGNALKVTVVTIQDGDAGGRLFDPIPDLMLETARVEPAVTLETNGIKAVCKDKGVADDGFMGATESSDACAFAYDDDATPIVNEMRVRDKGDGVPFREDREVVQGGSIWLKGSNFKPSVDSTITVTFGGAACVFESEDDYTDTIIECSVEHTTKGTYYPEVVVSTTGKASFKAGLGALTYGFELDKVTPTKSGYRGGTRVTIKGTGFSLDGPTNKIAIGGAPCPVIETNFDYVVCIAPAYTPTDGSDISDLENDGQDRKADITVGFFNDAVYKSQFTYAWGPTPILTSIEPTAWSSARTTTIVFFGTFNNKFTSSRNVSDGSTINCSATVHFVSPSGLTRECSQVQVHRKNVTCILPRGEAFPIDEQEHVFPRVQLCAQVSGIPVAVVSHPAPEYAEVDIALRMTSVSPSSGSLAGGTNVTITGAGFVNIGERIQRSAWTYNYDAPMTVINVALADRTVPCQISNSNFTSIECTTIMPSTLQASLSGPVAHTYDEKGYNGFITASINDFTVPDCTPAFASVSSTATSYKFTPGKWCAADDKFCFAWEHRDDNDQDGIIRIKMEGDGTQYVALGFADETNSMGPADVAMCTVGDDGEVAIEDRFSKTTGVEPDLDVSQDLFLESSSLIDGRLTCTFLRKIASTDLAQDRSLVPGGTNIIWSIKDVSETSDSMYHKARGSAAVDDFFAVTTDTDSQFTFQAPPHQQFDGNRDAAVCNFDYVDTATPTLEQVSPAEAAGSVLVTLTGSKFGSNPIVMVGSHNCPVQQTTITPTSIKCLVPKLAAGEYFFRVTVEGKGLAAHPDDDVVSFRSKLVFESTSPRRSSSAGGLITTIAGKGFNPVPSQNEVHMNNRRAHVQFASTERLIVVTPVQTQAVLADVSIKVQTDEIPNYFFGQLTPAVTLYSDEDGNEGVLPATPPDFADKCATENNVCKCTGTVYYGLNSDWFKLVAEDTIECSNTVFGDPLPGVGKECHCVTQGDVFVAPVGADVFELPTAYKVTAGAHCVDQTDEGVNCKVDYVSPSLSPAISSVVPSSGTKGTRIAIAGSKLAPELSFDTVEVNIGGEACDVVKAESNETHVICVVGATLAGSHPVYVSVGAFGTAQNSATRVFTSLASIDSISVASGSFGGGTEIVVKGKGFSGGDGDRRRADNGWGGWFIWEDQDGIVVDDELGTKIELGTTACTVTKTAYDELTCITEPLNSVDALLKYKHLEPATLEPESLSGASVAKLFDNDFGTTNGWVGVEAGFDLGADTKALATRIRFYPYHQAAATMEGGVFEVSADNSYWKPLAWVRQAHQGWNHVSLETKDQLAFRYFRFRSADGRLAKMTELVVLGYEVASSNTATMTIVTTKPMSHPSLGPMTTDHALLKKTATSTSFEFKEDATGTVTSITPRFGSSLGGTSVTIDGENLPTSIDNTDVLVNGQPCEVTKVTDGTSIECTTASRGHIQDMKPLGLVVRDLKAGMGNAVSNMSTRFRYLDRWSDVTTWLNDEPPIDGDTVIVPEDQTLLLDVQPPKLFVLLVHGMMVFDRMDLNLDASYILVQGGHLEIGTEDEPFLNTTTITLHGDRLKSIELPFVGAKMLAVADKGGFTTAANGRGADVPLSQKGVFDCHGKPRMRTWTKVAVGTIKMGTKAIETAEPTDFAKGEIIVLTAPHQELTVDERISPTKFTVVEEIAADHVSEVRHHVGEGGDFELDMRCEVALLSRNIVIQGAGGPRADGTPTIEEGDDEEASTAQLFGIHTGTFHGGHYRVENTELRHCGQAGVEGRYCMHFHVTDDNPAPYSYIKSNSIHHSFQRATTIHKTHHALVQNNVAYHVMGHTYFVEDGDEMYNTFDGNIGIFTRPSHMALKSDTGPATFWTAIPDNYWRNNIAVDSEDRGAWFELVHQGETLEFHNNSFHHNKGIGFRNYPNYSPPSPQYFTNNSYFKNGGNGVFYKKGGDNHHVFSKFAENGVDIFWTKYHTHDESRLIPNVHDCVFWGGRGAQAIFAPQHEFFYINGSTFIDYEENGVLSGCAGCCKAQTPRQGGYTVRTERLHWINSNQRTKWTCPYKQIFLDLDGSLTEHKGGSALPYYKFNDWDACSRNETTFGDGMVCDGSVRVRRLQLSEHSPRELDRKAISFKKSSTSLIDGANNTKVEVDAFGAVDWKQFHESGNLYTGKCYDGNGNNGNELDFSGCDESDYMDWITYRSINGEFHGWAVPMVTHGDYHVDIDWHIDFQTMNMRWSEPFYFYESYNQPLSSEVTNTPESVMLRWPYVDYRYRYRVNYDGDFNNQAQIAWYDVNSSRTDLGLPETFSRMDAFGASEIIRQDESLRTTACCGEWKVAMNPWEGITDAGQNEAKNPLVIDVKALQCGPSMCGLPGDIPDKWPDPLYWSNPDTWVFLAKQRINTADITMTGKKPQAGESVEIPQGVYILMDEDPPALDKLVVSGKLKFDGNSRHVEADRILVWGIMEVGDAENKPFNGEASITLHGVRTSPTLVATDQHYLGNKNLVVFGQLRMFGKLHTNRWVALESTANKGDTVITVQGAVEDWKVGDKIVVAGTEYPEPVDIVTPTEFKMEDYKPHEQEEVIIKAIDGQSITLESALMYRHFAGVVDVGRGDGVELRAHVGLLTSNLVIKGDLTDTPVAGQKNWYSGYGGHIVVGEVNFGSQDQMEKMKEQGEKLDTVRKLGSLYLAGVELRDMGKLASEHPAVLFHYFSDLKTDDYPTNKISNCAFSDAWNHAVSTRKSFGVEIEGNVMHKTWKNAVEIDVDSRASSVVGNLVVANQRSPDDFDERCLKDKSCMNNQFAAFMIWNKHFTEVSGNVAANSEDTGFIMYPVDECGTATDDLRIYNNIAYGNLVGAFLMDTGISDKCLTLTGFTSWKNAHLGIIAVDQSANLELKDVHVADNHQGISLNFVRKGIDNFARIVDSSVIGSSPASTCAASKECKAVGMKDVRGLGCNSEFGASWRRVGIVMPQYTNKKKTCDADSASDLCDPPTTVVRICALPWENRFGNVDVQHAEFNITSTSFAHWADDDCGMKSRAIAMNPSQPDFAPETFMTDTTWHASTELAKVNMGDVSYMTHEATACESSCDAVNFFAIKDTDGTAFDMYKHWDNAQQGEQLTLHADMNPAASHEEKCRQDNTTGAFFCRDYDLTRLVLESNPPRFTKRRIGPATIAKYGDDVSDNRTYWSVGPFPQGCSCQKHFAQFTFDVQSGQQHDIITKGILEARNRVTFASSDPNKCVLTKIFFSKPHPVKVTRALDDRSISPLKGVKPSLDNDNHVSGTNLLDPQERMLYIKLCGGENKQFWLEYENAVQVTASITMSYAQFFATDQSEREYTEQFVQNMALLLGIKQSQIKVVCVHKPGTPCTRGGGRHARQGETDDSGLEIFFEITPTLSSVQNGTEISTSDEEQAEELEALFDSIRTNRTQLLLRSALLTGDFDITDISMGAVATTTSTTATSVTSTLSSTTTATSSTLTSSTATSTSSTTTGSRTTSTTTESYTSTTSITETTATKTSTTTATTVTQTTQTSSTMTTVTLTTPTTVMVEESGLASDSSSTDQISVLAGVLACVAALIVIVAILLVRRTKKLSSGGYAMGTYEENVMSAPTKPRRSSSSSQKENTDTMIGEFVENATVLVEESAIDDTFAEEDTVEDGPGVFAFKASKFQDSLRVSKPSADSAAQVKELDTDLNQDSSADNDAELMVVQTATPIPAFQMDSRVVGRTFNMEDTEDCDEAETEGVEEELPSQFFGNRHKAVEHTNLELNPAMFGARGSVRALAEVETTTFNPITPDVLDDIDDLDLEPAEFSVGAVVDEYLSVDAVEMDDDDC
eukprot:m.29668 g.29668  ORF g.29668 m.29668 type:complete len:4542 (+) comp16144_c0_seq1:223-13848(+)